MIDENLDIFHVLYRSNIEGIIKCDLQGNILQANPAFLRMLGHRNLDAVISPAKNPTPNHWRSVELEIIHNEVLKHGSSNEFEKEYRHKDGSLIPVSLKLWLIYSDDGQRLLWGMVRPVIGKKKLQEEAVRAEKQVKRINYAKNEAREKERKAIASEIHDVIGQQLTAIKLELGMLRDTHVNNGDSRLKINKIMDIVNQCIHQVRHVCTELRPAVIDSVGFIQAIQDYCRQWEKISGIQVDMICDVEYLGKTLDLDLYRIVQEALTNVSRHASATKVLIRINQKPSKLVVLIHDNGVGFPSFKAGVNNSHGLKGMMERAEQHQGTLRFKNKNGAIIEAFFPFTGVHP